MSRLETLFKTKDKNICNIYFTAGFPKLDDTGKIIAALEKAGADMLEVGMPYSDPLADGPTIQASSTVALKNGMTLDLLFDQLAEIRNQTNIPLIIMGYVNQVMQYGEEKFLQKCKDVGIDGTILPDLPPEIYEAEYKDLFKKYGMSNVFLITPQTREERVRYLDGLSSGFLYMVADASITGQQKGLSDAQIDYFQRIRNMNLSNPRLIGFGISNHQNFSTACEYANGAIIGSAFIRALETVDNHELEEKRDARLAQTITDFIAGIKGENTAQAKKQAC